MTRTFLIIRTILLFFFMITLSAITASPDENLLQAYFTNAEQFLGAVSVSIDRAGPFAFQLDTGITNTIGQRRLANSVSLHSLRSANEQQVTGIEGSLSLSLAHSKSVSITGGMVSDLDLRALANATTLPSKRRYFAGNGFPGNFDLLIDNRHHVRGCSWGWSDVGHLLSVIETDAARSVDRIRRR